MVAAQPKRPASRDASLAEFTLPKKSKIAKGHQYKAEVGHAAGADLNSTARTQALEWST